MIRFVIAFLVLSSPAFAGHLLTQEEVEKTLSFGPWPPQFIADQSNRVSGNADAIALGERLFNDPILSQGGVFACASCHNPDQAFATPIPRAVGRGIELERNTPSVRNLQGMRWYGWAGRSDNLWAASLHPLVSEQELAQTTVSLKGVMVTSQYAEPFEGLFGALEFQSPEEVLVNVAKTLAAYQETLVTPPTSFDAFRDALDVGDSEAAAAYPKSAQRGLKLFLGRGNCSFCHNGPLFTNNEFHDAGVPYFTGLNKVDEGRHRGLKRVLNSPYTLAGSWSDDPAREGAWVVESVRYSHADFGMFKTPSLRGVAETAPYMHHGGLEDLEAVIRHYNTINLERMHTDGEFILSPLGLTESEIADLVAFLESLSTPR